MTDRRQNAAGTASDRDIPGIILGFAFLALGLAVHAIIPFQVSVEPIPGASQYVAFTPAAVPRLCATAFVLLGLLQLVRSLRPGSRVRTDGDQKRTFSAETARDILVLAGALLVYPVLMSNAGYVAATICFLLFLIVYGGERRPLVMGLCCIGIPLAVYFLFGKLMSIPFPDGRLFG